MKLSETIPPGCILRRLDGKGRDALFLEVAEHLHRQGHLRKPKEVAEKLAQREEMGSTAVGHEVAIPHCKLADLKEVCIAVGLHPDGLDFGAPDGRLVRLFFFVLSPQAQPTAHLTALARISKLVRAPGAVPNLLAAPTPEAFLEALKQEEKKL
jgi:PTS system nitrogen regulatory IIA component